MWDLKYGTHEPICKAGSQRGQTCSRQGRGGRQDGRTGLAGTTITCRADAPPGPSYTQHPAINHSGKGYFKKNVCMCIPESLCCTANSGLEFFLDFFYLKCMLSFSHTKTPGSEGHRGKKN